MVLYHSQKQCHMINVFFFRLESEIQEKKAQVPERQGDTEHFLEKWLLELRKKDFLNQS